jgi:hypothetical protein
MIRIAHNFRASLTPLCTFEASIGQGLRPEGERGDEPPGAASRRRHAPRPRRVQTTGDLAEFKATGDEPIASRDHKDDVLPPR